MRPGDPGSNLPSNLFSASFRPALVFFLAEEAGEGVVVLQGLASSRRQVILVFLFFLLSPVLLLFL